MFGKKKEEKPATFVRYVRYNKKCGCVGMIEVVIHANGQVQRSDLFDIRFCETHEKQIVDTYE